MIAVIDCRMPNSAKTKLREFCEVVELPPFSALDPRVASHPDMLMFAFDGKLFTSRCYYDEARAVIDKIIELTSMVLILTDDKTGNKYPNDITFNTFVINNRVICNAEYISKEIKKYAELHNIGVTSVKQGYAKCSAVVIDNAVISADKGICDTVQKLGTDALKITSDGVALDGYDCGFIGGASGVWKNKVFFCGDISKHKDCLSITNFCQSHGCEVFSLSDDPLYDVGTILFLE